MISARLGTLTAIERSGLPLADRATLVLEVLRISTAIDEGSIGAEDGLLVLRGIAAAVPPVPPSPVPQPPQPVAVGDLRVAA
jgi:hypothetical protein